MKYSVPAGIDPGKELEAFIKALEAILAMCDFASKNPSIPAEAGAEAAVEAYVRPVTDDLQSLAELKAFREGMEAARRLLLDDPLRARRVRAGELREYIAALKAQNATPTK
jgi:hypothetical protein